jgi:mannose-1-phosphate guanylyltransferase
MDKNTYCVIMAGGIGTRFWPLSRTLKPKQFLDILGTGKSLLRQTFERFTKVCPKENIFIVTNQIYGDIAAEQIPEITREQILLEPLRKNTAPCIAYASFKIKERNPFARIIVAPSDHLILKEDKFLEVVSEGLDFINGKDALLTLGIKPSRIETGYGYIQINSEEIKTRTSSIKKVKTFTEKPNYDMAKVFYESGEFFWNAGIFIWSLPSIMRAFDKYLPDIQSLFTESAEHFGTPKEEKVVNQIYANSTNISIDYGVMEKADNVYAFCSDFGWSDLGTWGSLYEHSELDKGHNSITGQNVFTYDTSHSIINVPDEKLVVIHGLENYIVVESNNTLLICRKDDEQKIKQFVNDVKISKGDRYL